MAVTWSWKEKIGSMINNKNQEINIYQANCLGAHIFEYKHPETNESMYQFCGWWNDKKHLTNCLGLTGDHKGENIYQDVVKLKLNSYYNESNEILSAFMKIQKQMPKLKIEVCYKPPKTEKQKKKIKIEVTE